MGRGVSVRRVIIRGRPLPIVLIALEKGVSALAAAAGGMLALLVRHRGGGEALQLLLPREVLETPRDFWVQWLYVHQPHLGTGLLMWLAIGLFFWAALLAAESLGVWAGRAWGEFLVIVETASFLPAELYDIARRPHLTGLVTLLLNILILWYVGSLYRTRRRGRAVAQTAPEAAAARERPAWDPEKP